VSVFGLDIAPEAVCVFNGPVNMYEALAMLTRGVCNASGHTDCSGWLEAVNEREAVMTTGIGGGIAIPHVRTADLAHPAIGVGLSREGIVYETLDQHPVHVIVLFAMPEHAEREYLGLLAQVMQAVRRRELFEQLLACRTREDVLDVLQDGSGTGRRVQARG
jgi:mannitol/fructose-specific phosphotransferase system IIA component (Ntr-type)